MLNKSVVSVDNAINFIMHTLIIHTGLVNALDSSDTVNVTDNGVTVTMKNGMPKVYYVSRSGAPVTSDQGSSDDGHDNKSNDHCSSLTVNIFISYRSEHGRIYRSVTAHSNGSSHCSSDGACVTAQPDHCIII